MVTITTVQKSKKAASLKTWILESRPQYLLLPVVLILVGTAVAWHSGTVNPVYAILALIGLILCHMSVNILNDYYDFKSGVDLKTVRSPFNGGSGILPAGLLKSRQVCRYGLACFLLAIPFGIFFIVVQGWQLLPLLVVGAICILLYTPIILKMNFPEWSPGVGLGLLPVLGAYFVQTGTYSAAAVVAAVPSGILVLNLLLLNEFPDVEADMVGRKKTLPIIVGKRNAAIVYSFLTILVYLWIIGAAAAGQMPLFTLIALLSLPFAYKAIRGSFNNSEMHKIVPAMANNVIVVLLTQALIGIGYILATVF